jgi:NADH-quinone oxidoreductase subunit M
MFDFSLLLLVLLALPAVAAVAVALLGLLEPEQRGPAARWVSLGATVLSLVLSAVLAGHFAGLDRSQMDAAKGFSPELVRVYPLLELPFSGTAGAAIQFYIGLDGLNVWLVVLTSILMVSSVLGSWTSIKERTTEFYAWLLALQAGLFGVFLSFDIVLFYVFFELTLVPLFFLIGIWGGPQRQYAARKFFVFTLTGSLITLLGVFGIVLTLAQFSPAPKVGPRPLTFAIPELVAGVKEFNRIVPAERDKASSALDKARADRISTEDAIKEAETRLTAAEAKLSFWQGVQFWVFLAMMAGFAIKVPLVPVHTWLPLAHVEAPTAGSVLLAGVLLKIGTYGFLRLCLPLAPYASLNFGAPVIGWLAVVGILYGALCAYAQDDIKKLVAYSSVSHLGYCMLGMFALNETGLTGSLLQMVNHGLSTGGLFLLVGMLYERYHTRKMADYGGMGSKLKILATLMVFMGMSSVALPGLNGFWGEFAVLSGMFNFAGTEVSGRLLVYLAIGGVVLGALYTLTMLRRVFFGEVREPHHDGHGPAPDLNLREMLALAPIVICCFAIGIYPNAFTVPAAPDLRFVARLVAEERAQEQAKSATAQTGSSPRVAGVNEK